MIFVLSPKRVSLAATLVLSLALAACGEASHGPPASDDDSSLGGAGTGGPGPSPEGKVRRLRQAEWERSVRDLFNLADLLPLKTDIPLDPVSQGYLFEGTADSLRMDQTLSIAYQRAAQEAAEILTRYPEVVDAIAPSAGYSDDSDRARGFVTSLLPRAFRRPATDTEFTRYEEQFSLGAASYDDRDPFAAGVRLVIESVLQSPYFMYRTEFSNKASQGGLVPLNGYERATRLSYFLWGTAPDAELFGFAEEGVLDSREGVLAVADRMLGDKRADESLRYFFDRSLDVERYARISPSPSAFPSAPANLSSLAHEEFRRFVVDVVFRKGGGVRDLFTSLETYVNPELAAIYGVSAPAADGFGLVKLDPSQRTGLLTQIGFLASHATSVDPDPIHRGVFVGRNIACLTINAPPANIPPLPDPEGRTNREVVESHTQEPDTICAECHATLINPLGFPFENYDAIGAYRTLDREQPVDASSEPLIDGNPVPVSNALELSTQLSESLEVHRCFARRIVELGQGRKMTANDEEMAQVLGDASFQEGLSFEQLLIQFVASDAFLFRSPEEASL